MVVLKTEATGTSSNFTPRLFQPKGCLGRVVTIDIFALQNYPPRDIDLWCFQPALVPNESMYKLFQNCPWRDKATKAGNSCKVTAGNIRSTDLWIPKLNRANDFQYSQFYFSTKHSKLNKYMIGVSQQGKRNLCSISHVSKKSSQLHC